MHDQVLSYVSYNTQQILQLLGQKRETENSHLQCNVKLA